MGYSGRVQNACALAAAVWLAAPAEAQVTNCTTFGNNTQCRTDQGIDPTIPLRGQLPDYGAMFRAQQEQRQRLEQRRQAEMQADQALAASQQQQAREELSRVVHEGVGDYLKQGKCDAAVAMALQYGEVELATQAKAFCAVPQK